MDYDVDVTRLLWLIAENCNRYTFFFVHDGAICITWWGIHVKTNITSDSKYWTKERIKNLSERINIYPPPYSSIDQLGPIIGIITI